MPRINKYGQPIGDEVSNWTTRSEPENVTLVGRTCQVEPLDDVKHTEDLFDAYLQAPDGSDWTYLFEERFDELEPFRKYIKTIAREKDPKFYAVIDLTTHKAVGMYSLMRIDPKNGVIEVGFITFSPLLKQTVQSTEAQYLLMAYCFDELGYRRYEWKCDSFHAKSRKAAIRLGFKYEGVFRNAIVTKGRNRDTAWFSIIDGEWPNIKSAFEAWLSPNNFDNQGKQLKNLAELRESCGTGES
ncbi:uncharacterized protein YIR042C-like [Contarinia nasturtii]|uniref:uncharacterized protein YIR042C-like n=1 Tax=Contarinia nasturtii TaxID=265458 RepID=UPI0012D40B18|nr:uncharacterized protein YIR042C-like [Contarinia nasturtii]XP_031630694.1 uncharacterized protein YIR042C-like [Contarinia nasturtii]